jgi:predicted RNase H-like nuclease (RuvC/YqgF family)
MLVMHFSALKRPTRTALFATFAASLFLSVGCQTTPQRQATRATSTVASAADELESARNQINAATVALDQIVNYPHADLRPAYNQYRRSVDDLERTAAALDRRGAEVAQRRQEYVATWERENAAIQNEAIRARSYARLQEVDNQLAQLERNYINAREQFLPLVNDLRDIERMLSVDLTAAGIQNARNYFGQVDRNAENARQSVARLAQEFRAASTLLEPGAARIAE